MTESSHNKLKEENARTTKKDVDLEPIKCRKCDSMLCRGKVEVDIVEIKCRKCGTFNYIGSLKK